MRFASQLDDARRQAEAANSAKSAFLAMMSHELRTPLNAINGFSEVMVQGVFGPLEPRYRDSSEAILQSGKRLLSIINTILDLTKIEAGTIDADEQDIDIGSVIRANVTMLDQQAQSAGILLSMEVDSETPTMRADERIV